MQIALPYKGLIPLLSPTIQKSYNFQDYCFKCPWAWDIFLCYTLISKFQGKRSYLDFPRFDMLSTHTLTGIIPSQKASIVPAIEILLFKSIYTVHSVSSWCRLHLLTYCRQYMKALTKSIPLVLTLISQILGWLVRPSSPRYSYI